MNDILIRRASSNDIFHLLKIQNICYKDNYREDEAIFEHMMSVFSQGVIKAELNKAIIGYVCFHPYYSGTCKPLNDATFCLKGDENCLYLHDMCIHPDYRGLGITKLLFKSFESELAAHNYKEAALVAVQGSENFWAKQGFSVIKPIYYGAEKSYYMIKYY